MRPTETPSSRATSRFSATARSARPADVLWISHANAPTRTIVTPMTASCITPTLSEPSVRRSSNNSDGNCSGSEPQTLVTTFCRMMEKPSVESIGVIGGASRSGS